MTGVWVLKSANGERPSALTLAARTASVTYRTSMTAGQLRHALTTQTIPVGFAPHLYDLLDEAPESLLRRVAEELGSENDLGSKPVWETMRTLAHRLKSSRALWS